MEHRLLRDAVPSANTIAVLLHASYSTAATQLHGVEEAAARLAVQLVVARANSESDFDVAQPILRQSRLGQALGDAREIARVFVRQDARALVERETRVDLEQLGPRRARVLDAPEMAVAGCEHHAA
jgi:hypothetical protein